MSTNLQLIGFFIQQQRVSLSLKRNQSIASLFDKDSSITDRCTFSYIRMQFQPLETPTFFLFITIILKNELHIIAHTDKNMQKQQHRKYQTRETNLSCNYKQKELHIVRSCPFPPPFTYSNKESFQQAERSGQESCAGPLSGPLLL